MALTSLEEQVRNRLQTAVSIEARGLNDYRVHLPFTFPDGDELKMILKKESSGRWELSDEGHTLMFLSYYDLDLTAKSRESIIDSVLKSHFMKDNNGRFVMQDIANGDEAGAIFTFAQGLLKIGDLSMWKRKKSQAEFLKNFRAAIEDGVCGRETTFDYYDPVNDKDRLYPVDSAVTLHNKRPLYIFGVNSDTKADRSMVTMYHLQRFTPDIPMCVVFAAPDSVRSATRSRVDDAADKTLSLNAVPERLDSFMKKYEVAS